MSVLKWILSVGLCINLQVTGGCAKKMNAEQAFQNGKYKLETVSHEMRMSHWVFAPVLTDTQSGEILLDLSGGLWELRSAQESGASITLSLARYPDGIKEYAVELLPQEKRALVLGVSYPLAELKAALEALALAIDPDS